MTPALPFLSTITKLTWSEAIDIVVVAVIVYQLILIVKGRRAAHILTGVGIIAVSYSISVWANLELLRSLLSTVAPYTAFALIVMFQSEIRGMLARIGRRRWFAYGSRFQRRESADEIVLAVGQLAKNKIGALIVLERDIGLRTFIESGVILDAVLSRDLLLAIFEPGAAMHDGAAVVQGNRVAAAACFLPLTMNPVLYRELGTRHRAAIGITEEADCLAVIVSEETGRISLAAFGELETDVKMDRLAARLELHNSRKDPVRQPGALPVPVQTVREESTPS
jgi:diadenylate cyclase